MRCPTCDSFILHWESRSNILAVSCVPTATFTNLHGLCSYCPSWHLAEASLTSKASHPCPWSACCPSSALGLCSYIQLPCPQAFVLTPLWVCMVTAPSSSQIFGAHSLSGDLRVAEGRGQPCCLPSLFLSPSFITFLSLNLRPHLSVCLTDVPTGLLCSLFVWCS